MKIFLIAGEPSGDKLGAALMTGLRELAPNVTFAGVGGPLMEAEGMTSLFPMEELSIMGIAEVLPKYFHLKRRIRETADAVLTWEPAAVITIDSPDFCLRVARLVKDATPEQETIHYVAPSVWAWRPGRAKKMAKVIDHVLALLPFEPPYMTAAGMSCDFVGHPVTTEPRATTEQAKALRERLGVGDKPMVLCLPGSRRGEVTRLAPKFGETLGLLRERIPDFCVVTPTVRGVEGLVRELSADWPVQPHIVIERQDRLAAFAAADVALAASGTISLELAANRIPMVIAYDASFISWHIIWNLLRVDTVTLVNLVSQTRAVPEFLGPKCTAELMAPALAELMTDPAKRDTQIAAMNDTMARLGEGGDPPGLRAAHSVLDVLGYSSKGTTSTV